MNRRSHPGWGSPLGRFVSQVGVPRLCREFAAQGLPITKAAVYSWVHGTHFPSPATRSILLALAGDRLRYEDL